MIVCLPIKKIYKRSFNLCLYNVALVKYLCVYYKKNLLIEISRKFIIKNDRSKATLECVIWNVRGSYHTNCPYWFVQDHIWWWPYMYRFIFVLNSWSKKKNLCVEYINGLLLKKVCAFEKLDAKTIKLQARVIEYERRYLTRK